MVVMFWPKTTSSAAQLKKSAIAARASAIISSVRRLVRNAPPVLAFAVEQIILNRVHHLLGTCVPAGPSRNAAGWPFTCSCKEGNCARTQAISSCLSTIGFVHSGCAHMSPSQEQIATVSFSHSSAHTETPPAC